MMSDQYGWQPRTEGDRLAQEQGRQAGCCGNDAWRGRLCQYHQGWADGWDERQERLVGATRDAAAAGEPQEPSDPAPALVWPQIVRLIRAAQDGSYPGVSIIPGPEHETPYLTDNEAQAIIQAGMAHLDDLAQLASHVYRGADGWRGCDDPVLREAAPRQDESLQDWLRRAWTSPDLLGVTQRRHAVAFDGVWLVTQLEWGDFWAVGWVIQDETSGQIIAVVFDTAD